MLSFSPGCERGRRLLTWGRGLRETPDPAGPGRGTLMRRPWHGCQSAGIPRQSVPHSLPAQAPGAYIGVVHATVAVRAEYDQALRSEGVGRRPLRQVERMAHLAQLGLRHVLRWGREFVAESLIQHLGLTSRHVRCQAACTKDKIEESRIHSPDAVAHSDGGYLTVPLFLASFLLPLRTSRPRPCAPAGSRSL